MADDYRITLYGLCTTYLNNFKEELKHSQGIKIELHHVDGHIEERITSKDKFADTMLEIIDTKDKFNNFSTIKFYSVEPNLYLTELNITH